jgi:hypothetical protein
MLLVITICDPKGRKSSSIGLTGGPWGAYNLAQEGKMRTATYPDVHALAAKVEPELLRALATLSQHRQAEVLDFARFLGQLAEKNMPAEARSEVRIELRPAPADTLVRLTGLVALGGDALTDSEALYDDNGSR